MNIDILLILLMVLNLCIVVVYDFLIDDSAAAIMYIRFIAFGVVVLYLRLLGLKNET